MSARRVFACALAAALLAACSQGDRAPNDERPRTPLPADSEFVLLPEFDGPCERRGSIDVNLGHEPEAFVRAAHCQITGSEPPPELVASWSEALRTQSWVRRIDVVLRLCSAVERDCALRYSEPWREQVQLTRSCTRKNARDLGAVLMFFNDCPSGANCGMDWANTHVPGMQYAHPLYAFGAAEQGFYHGQSPGFWRRELLDARWAGLQFLLLNFYGPDLGRLGALQQALAEIGGGIQIAMFDDSWAWGRTTLPAPWNVAPSLSDPEAAARTIYDAKWKPFFEAVPRDSWYLVAGRPLVYFYNAGTLKPLAESSATIARLKRHFTADFGVEPFVAVDRAYFQDPGTAAVADSEFIWDTFRADEPSHFELTAVTHDHFMVKWDSLGRDRGKTIASEADRLVKGPELLQRALSESAESDLVVIATWNDIGEGTGINRNYDYYYQGRWLSPHAFMKMVRDAQCAD